MMSAARFLTTLDKSVKEVLSRKSLKPLVTILAIFGLEQILSTKSFYHCPEAGYRLYGALFLFGPGACFFILALLMNNSFWNSVTGCYKGNFDRGQVCRKTLTALGKCSLVGFAWLVLAFADTKFYLCLCLGPMPSQDSLKNMDKDQREKIQHNFSKMKSQSTVIAWLLFLFLVFLSLLFIIVRRCCFLEVEESLPSLREYQKLEEKAAFAKFKEKMKILAEKEGEEQVELQIDHGLESKNTYSAVMTTRAWLARKYLGANDNFSRYCILNDAFNPEEIDAEARM